MIADLHCHSVCSDGFNTTEELVDYASRAGLSHLALTDHDTMMGVERISQEAQQKHIRIIPGVECTCTDHTRNRSVHMLCYAPKYPAQLQAFLDETLRRRRESKLQMAELISRQYPLTLEDVLKASKDSASIHEVHLIAPLAAMGYTATVCGDLLKQLIGKQGSCYVPIAYPDVRDVVRMIHEMGGLAVLAHPGQFDSMLLAEELAQKGWLDGIECFHPRNNQAITQQAQELCSEYHLLVTGGSDFHGMYSAKPCPLGSYTISKKQLTHFLEAAK